MIDNLIKQAQNYHPDLDQDLIRQAYDFAEVAYDGQTRLNGELQIHHALSVAFHLTNVRVDSATIAAGLLHDVMSGSRLTRADLIDYFPVEVVDIIYWVNELKRIQTKVGGREYQDNLRGLILNVSRDVRVVLIRLAEKLHGLETIHSLQDQKRVHSLQKIFDVYAPLSERLGSAYFKRNLEDLAFKHTYPESFEQIAHYFKENRIHQEEILSQIRHELVLELEKGGLDAEVFGRVKHNYSILKKYQQDHQRRKSQDTIIEYLSKLHDLFAYTILVANEADCYQALDIVHQRWEYDPDELDDYIANPKPNGYRSIQSAILFGPQIRAEVQIRTHQMHEFNEFGPASHLFYKEIGRGKFNKMVPAEKIAWLRDLVRWKEVILDKASGLNSDLSTDKLLGQIFVFTPKGDLVDLPVNSTPLDFAYAVHTEIGDHAVRAKVNGRVVSFDCSLKNGDVCEIESDQKNKGPSLDWLQFVRTKFARNRIRQSLKNGV